MKTKFYFLSATLLFSVFLWLACSSTDSANSSELGVEESVNEEQTEDTNTQDFDAEGYISPNELVLKMGVGWNLGNSFDVESRDKTAWGNPLPTKAMIDLVANSGFNTLRIPVTWGYHQDENSPYAIEPDYLNRVQDVVDIALENQLIVIINVHHDDDWVKLEADKKDDVIARLSSLWTQVATRFKAYDNRLIFEILNEPRLKGTPLEWNGGNAESRAILNEYHKAGVEAIRAVEGFNANRVLMVSTYAASTIDEVMNDLIIPNSDENILISLHSYFPWSFAGEENGPSEWGSEAEKEALKNEMEKIYQKWVVSENRNVILGEWGSRNKNNLEDRVAYATNYTQLALQYGFIPIVWDDGGNFRLQNRNTISWQYSEIVDAITNP
ncbi:endoglucanase [Croceivirga lutea]|uniref:glycoside hydrolase family 5 protein n=1 Tax=Croceivirga lutea TaxID=1775167 RepID=UPI00163B1176|nr:glycoside hydrolase family 5 protein [Croceivirga lutea]GGG53068.1 endoglucanase [Croceivirga lutea]